MNLGQDGAKRMEQYMAKLMEKATHPSAETDLIMKVIKNEMKSYPNMRRPLISAALGSFNGPNLYYLSVEDHGLLAEFANRRHSGGRCLWGVFYEADYNRSIAENGAGQEESESEEEVDSTYDSEDDMVPPGEEHVANGIHQHAQGFTTMWSGHP